MYIRIYVYVCVWYVRALRMRRGFSWLSYNGRRRSAPRGERGRKDKRGTCGTRAVREIFLIHNYTYT